MQPPPVASNAREKLGLSTRTLLRGLEGTFIEGQREKICYAKTDCPGCSKGFWKMYGHYVRAGILRSGWVDKAYSVLAPADACLEIEIEKLKGDPRSVLCDNPGCLSCATRYYALSRVPRFLISQAARRLSM